MSDYLYILILPQTQTKDILKRKQIIGIKNKQTKKKTIIKKSRVPNIAKILRTQSLRNTETKSVSKAQENESSHFFFYL